MTLRGYRKWSIAMAGMLLGFIAALLGKLTAELASVLGAAVSGFMAANGYTTGRGKEAQPE